MPKRKKNTGEWLEIRAFLDLEDVTEDNRWGHEATQAYADEGLFVVSEDDLFDES